MCGPYQGLEKEYCTRTEAEEWIIFDATGILLLFFVCVSVRREEAEYAGVCTLLYVEVHGPLFFPLTALT